MRAAKRSSFEESDAMIVVVTGRTQGNLKNLHGDRQLSYQRYSSTLFSLHRDVLCEGPRSSTVLKSLFALSDADQQARLEIDMLEEEAEAFPRLVDYIYHGVPISEDDTALGSLAKRYGVFPELSGSVQASSTKKSSSKSARRRRSRKNKSSNAQSPKVKSLAHAILTFLLAIPKSIREILLKMCDAVKHMLIKESSQNIRDSLPGMRSEASDTSKSMSSTKKAQLCPVAANASKTMLSTKKVQLCPTAANASKTMLSTKKAQLCPTTTNASFRGIPDLMRGMRSNCEETRHQSQASLKTILSIPKGQERDVASIVCSTGAIPSILEILSGDQYATLHVAAVETLKLVAKDSIFHADRLVKSLVTEKMLECQLVKGMDIRVGALEVMTAIALHSASLCSQVLDKRECLNSVVVACNRKETKHAAWLLLCQFCALFPKRMLKESVVKVIAEHMILHQDKDVFMAASANFESLANAAVSDDNDILGNGVDAIILVITAFSDVGNEYAPAVQHVLEVLTRLAHKPFILRPIFQCFGPPAYIPHLLWSPCKQVQVLTCPLVAAMAKNLSEDHRAKELEDWYKTDLLPPLVTLFAHEGVTRVPATMAITHLIRYSDLCAQAFVAADGIPPLCDVLSCHNNEGLQMNILLALQRLFEIGTGDALNLIGMNLARAMLARPLFANQPSRN